jgi:hypothetical protein
MELLGNLIERKINVMKINVMEINVMKINVIKINVIKIIGIQNQTNPYDALLICLFSRNKSD